MVFGQVIRVSAWGQRDGSEWFPLALVALTPRVARRQLDLRFQGLPLGVPPEAQPVSPVPLPRLSRGPGPSSVSKEEKERSVG